MKTLVITTMSERVFKNVIVNDNSFEPGYPTQEIGNVERATTIDDCLVLVPFEGQIMRFKYDTVTVNGSSFTNVYLLLKALKTIGYAQYYNVSSGNSSGGATTSVEEIYYTVSTAFTGANVGDVLLNRQVVNLSDGAIQSETWTNLTTGLALSSAPAAAKITAQSATPLTNAQLSAQGLGKESTQQAILTAIKAQGGAESVIDSAATPVIWNMVLDTAATPPTVVYYQYGTTTVGTPTFPVKPYEYVSGAVTVSSSVLPTGAATSALQTTGNTSLDNIDKDLGAIADTPATTDVGSFSLISLIKRGLQNWTSLLGRIPSLGAKNNAGSISVTPSTDSGLAMDGTDATGVSQLTGGVGIRGWLSGIFSKISTLVTNMTNGSQKGQIVDAAGNVITSTTINTKQRLDVNLASAAAPNATAPNIGDMVGGTDGANFKPLLMDSVGALKVNTAATTFTYSSNNSTNGNSSVFALANGATWNGTIENAINQPYLITGVISNQNVTLTISQYLDAAGTNKDVADKTFSITANVPFSLPVAVLGNYIKLSVSNVSGSAANIYVDSYYGSLPVQPDTLTPAGNFRTAIQEPIPAGSNVIGKTSADVSNYGVTNSVFAGGSSQPQLTLTNTAGAAYAAGNVVGGVITLPNALQAAVLSGTLESLTLSIKSLQTASFKLYLMKGTPSTTFTDKTAPAIVTADAANVLDVYNFTTPDNGLGNNVTIYTADSISRTFISTNTNVYFVLITLGTPTFTTTSDIVLTAGILKD